MWGCSPECSEQELVFIISSSLIKPSANILHFIAIYEIAPGELVGSSWTVAASRCTYPGRPLQEPSSVLQLWFPEFIVPSSARSIKSRHCCPIWWKFLSLAGGLPSTFQWRRWRPQQGAPSHTLGPVEGKPLLKSLLWNSTKFFNWRFVNSPPTQDISVYKICSMRPSRWWWMFLSQ